MAELLQSLAQLDIVSQHKQFMPLNTEMTPLKLGNMERCHQGSYPNFLPECVPTAPLPPAILLVGKYIKPPSNRRRYRWGFSLIVRTATQNQVELDIWGSLDL